MALDWLHIDDYYPGNKVYKALVLLDNGDIKVWDRRANQDFGNWKVPDKREDGRTMYRVALVKKWIDLTNEGKYI